MSSTKASESSGITFKLFFPAALSILLLVVVVCTTCFFPALIERSDFLSCFYVAGRMVKEGQVQYLYPSLTATSLMATPFDHYAHHILPAFPANLNAAYMYPPLLALVFAPFAWLSPQGAFLLWQVLSILAFCSFLLASRANKSAFSYFWLSLLFLPVFQTIYIGHIGIVLGLVPLCLGYWCLLRGQPVACGLLWSLMLLKLQFLPMVLLMVMALALGRRFVCLGAFVIGAIGLIISNISCFGLTTAHQWLASLSLSDAIFSDAKYGYPTYLVSSMPAAVLQLLPFAWRVTAKYVLYLIAALIGLHALTICWRLIKRTQADCLSVMPFVFVVGAFVLPLILPHFLYYDLSVLAVAGMIIYGQPALRSNRHLMRDFILSWVFIDAYFVAILFTKTQLAKPLALVLVLGLLYWRILKVVCQLADNQLPDQAANDHY